MTNRDCPWMKERSGENHPNFGKHPNEETKQKMRESHLGKKRGPYKKKLIEIVE